MSSLRQNPPKELCGSKVVKIYDYGTSLSYDKISNTETVITLPKSNVLSYFLEDSSTFIVRPSGTEPKIKTYICAVGKTHNEAEQRRDDLVNAGTSLLGF